MAPNGHEPGSASRSHPRSRQAKWRPTTRGRYPPRPCKERISACGQDMVERDGRWRPAGADKNMQDLARELPTCLTPARSSVVSAAAKSF
jgi:hypothetical protein